MQLGYVIIYVPDVTAAIEFYERAFGLACRFIHESGQYAELETGATALAFAAEGFVAASVGRFGPNRADQEPAGSELGFVTHDVDVAFQRAIAAGAAAHVKPQLKPWGQIVAYVRDLNGYLVEIGSPIGQ